METIFYPQFPAHRSLVHVGLFTQVVNPSLLRSRIIKASTTDGDQGLLEREAVNFAFIDARLVTSLLHLQTAIHQVILADLHGSLRTKTVHSEILWLLNPTNNITEAIRRYGVSDTTTALFVVRIASPDESETMADKMKAVVPGCMVPLTTLAQLTDWCSIKKLYKLDAEPAVQNAAKNVARENAVVDNIVVSSVAMKSVMA